MLALRAQRWVRVAFLPFFFLFLMHLLCFLVKPFLHFVIFFTGGFGGDTAAGGGMFSSPEDVRLEGVEKVGGALGAP